MALPEAGLCVVSDPSEDLPSTAAEGESVAASLVQGGADVTVMARRGTTIGAAAFVRRGVTVRSGIKVLDSNPTPERIAGLMPDKDHFFYSGYCTRVDGQSGLIVVNEEGTETLFSEDEILSMHALRKQPLIVLSAC